MYPDHPDFDYSREVEALRADRDREYDRQPWIGFVVSQSWKDTEWAETFIDQLAAKYPKATIILPERAAGATKEAAQRFIDHNLTVVEVKSEATWGTQRQAVQAARFCRLSDVLMICWAGGADLAKAVIDKALDVHRPLPQFLPGLHVYEQTKTRATKSKKAQLTGRVRYRIRDNNQLEERKAA